MSKNTKNNKKTTKTSSVNSKSKTTTKTKVKKVVKKDIKPIVYKRGTLSQVIWNQLETLGVDNVTYQEMYDLAIATMANTKFQKSHYSWYKNKFRKDLELGKYPNYKF
jgi:hypothetical protein